MSSKARHSIQKRIHEIIFEADTKAGRLFDLVLIISILLSVLAVMLDSVASVRLAYGRYLIMLEWFFTILFSIEYILRLISVGRPIHYAFSFYGIIDFLAIIPTYLSLVLPGSQFFLVIRILRVLRIFRILKLAKYTKQANHLAEALKASRRKITVFLFTVLTLVVIFGSLMYMIEGEKNGFTSIPHSIYWAIVTLTTVGYGDISPQTALGQALAAVIMILGYGIIAVPTGIVSAELVQTYKTNLNTQSCRNCTAMNHDDDALFCKYCGEKL